MQGITNKTHSLLLQLAAKWGCSVEEVLQRFQELEERGEAHAISLRVQADLANYQTHQIRLELANLWGSAVEEAEGQAMQRLQQSRWVAALSGDLWRWQAFYHDDSVLDEVEADGRQHGWAEVDQARLAAVALLPQHPTLPVHVLKLHEGQRAVFFRRKGIIRDPDTGFQMQMAAVTVLGWEHPESGLALYTFYHWDGSTVLSTNRQEIEAG